MFRVSSVATPGGAVVKQPAGGEDVPPQVSVTGASGTDVTVAVTLCVCVFVCVCVCARARNEHACRLCVFRAAARLHHHTHNPPAAAHPGGFWDVLFSDAQQKVRSNSAGSILGSQNQPAGVAESSSRFWWLVCSTYNNGFFLKPSGPDSFASSF